MFPILESYYSDRTNADNIIQQETSEICRSLFVLIIFSSITYRTSAEMYRCKLGILHIK